jgi:hypothetical protein
MIGLLKQARGQAGANGELEQKAPEQSPEPQMQGQAVPQGDMPEQELDPDSHPEMARMKQFMDQALYESGGADHIARALQAAPNKATALGQMAYQIFSTVDEKSEGAIPDELLDAAMSYILTEVADIATTAQVEFTPEDVVVAKRMMIENMAVELGLDADELVDALGAVDPADVAQFAMSEDANVLGAA